MRLRWFITCNKDGVKSKPTLQYWNAGIELWEDVPHVECKTWEEDVYLKDINAYC